jgi:hypothetical protein
MPSTKKRHKRLRGSGDITQRVLNLGTQIQDPTYINSTNEGKMVETCSNQDMRNARKFRAEILMEAYQWKDYGTEGNIRIDPAGSGSAD